MIEPYILFFAGMLFGWVTKIPIFLKYYRESKMERQESQRLYKKILEMMERGDL